MAQDEQDDGHEDGAEGHGDGGGDADEMEVEDAEDDGDCEQQHDDVGAAELPHDALRRGRGGGGVGGFVQCGRQLAHGEKRVGEERRHGAALLQGASGGDRCESGRVKP